MNSSEMLRWVIALADKRTSELDPLEVTDANADLFMVTTSMIATAMNHTKAIWILVEAGFDTTAGPIERALYEVWAELKYLLTEGNPGRNAAKVLVNGALEVADFLDGRGVTTTIEQVIAHHRMRHGEIVDEMVAQRSRKPPRYRWSGKSHSAIERAVAPDSFMYRVLSWEAHAALNSVRDVSTEPTGEGTARFVFGRRLESDVGIERRCAMTTVLMYDMLRLYVATWKLDDLPELPPLPSFPARARSA
jgi:uncharacterized protein DUF5677